MIIGLNLALAPRHRTGLAPAPTNLSLLSSMLRGTGGKSALHDYSLATISGGVWSSTDLSGNGNHHTQANSTQRPAISSEGAVFNASTQNVRQTITGGTFTIVMTFRRNAANNGFVLTNQTSIERLRYQSGNNGGLGSIVDVNAITVSTCNQLYLALDSNAFSRVTARNVNFTGDTQIQLGRSGGSALGGTVRWMIVLDHAALGSDLAAAVALAQAVATL